jgi:hypothetical protein
LISFFYIIIIYILLLATHTHTASLMNRRKKKTKSSLYLHLFSLKLCFSLIAQQLCSSLYDTRGAFFPAVSCSVPHYRKNCFIYFVFYLGSSNWYSEQPPSKKKWIGNKSGSESLPPPPLYSRETGLEKKLINAAEYIYNIVCVERKREREISSSMIWIAQHHQIFHL